MATPLAASAVKVCRIDIGRTIGVERSSAQELSTKTGNSRSHTSRVDIMSNS